MAAAKPPQQDAESQYLLGYMYEVSPFEADAVGSTSTAAAPEPEPEGRSSQGEEERRSEEERQSEEEYREMCRLAGRILPREHVWE